MLFADYSYIFLYLLLGVLFSLILSRAAIYTANRLGLIDIPGILPHKMHNAPTPLAGGITLIACLLISIPIAGFYKSPEILKVLLALLVIFGFGLWDDKKRIRARYKILGQILATLLLILSGVSIQFLESLIGPSSPYIGLAFWLDRILTLFWVIGITNAYNLIDSMDGLAIGLANLAFAFFILASIISGQNELTVMFSLLLGVGIGISLYNSTPAKLFLGDSGAQSIGFLLATLAILYHPLGKEQTSTWFVKVMLMGLPIFDTSLVFFSRVRQGQSFYIAGRDHTYHRLVDLGLSPGRAVGIMQMAALMLNCLAFIAVPLSPLYSNMIFGGALLAAAAIFIYFEKNRLSTDIL